MPEDVRLSKRLSFVLRHRPDKVGLERQAALRAAGRPDPCAAGAQRPGRPRLRGCRAACDPLARHAVHLSGDRATAEAVGFTVSGNGVWLVDHVPAVYLTVED